jgi:translation initiation factor 5A
MAEEDSYNQRSVSDVSKGSFILIDGVPCKVVEMETSKPGKHGSAKARITAVGIFDGQKKTLLMPTHGDVLVPEIKKRRAQVVSITADSAQLMDLESYEIYDSIIPEEVKSSLKQGVEVEVLECMGKRAITRVIGGG